ncbi:MAG: sugar phosphate isomerase/epimerase [Oscillospiraceae bacterium]|nr:sugar phosphate isomerase/epimerase [Oscillospiraceae bacterium]
MFKIGFMPNGNMLGWEPEKLCGYIKNAGYEAIEVQPPLFCGGKTEEDRKRLRRAAEQNGLVISEAVLQRDFVMTDDGARAANIEYVKENMLKAAEMGIQTINVFTGPAPWVQNPVVVGTHITQKKAWSMVFEAFDCILPAAEKNNVNIAVENVFGMLCHDFYTNMHLNRHYDSPRLGVNFDPSHDALYGNTDMEFLISGWGKEKIFHAHLKDAAGIPEMGKFLFPILGEGVVDWKAFFSEMKKIGYEGAMSVEFESFAYLNSVLGGRFEEAAGLSRKIIAVLMEDSDI